MLAATTQSTGQRANTLAALGSNGGRDPAPFTDMLNAASRTNARSASLVTISTGKDLPPAPTDGSDLPVVAVKPSAQPSEEPKDPLPAMTLPGMTGLTDEFAHDDRLSGSIEDRECKPSRASALDAQAVPTGQSSFEMVAMTVIVPAAVVDITAPATLVDPAKPLTTASQSPVTGPPVAASSMDAAKVAMQAPISTAVALPEVVITAQSSTSSHPDAKSLPAPAFPEVTTRAGRRESARADAAPTDSIGTNAAAPPSSVPSAPPLTTLAMSSNAATPGHDLAVARPAVTAHQPEHHITVEALLQRRGDNSQAAVMLVRNADFGPISIRLDEVGATLHAMLGSNDPELRSSVIAAADQSARALASSAAASLRDAAGDRPGGTGSPRAPADTTRQDQSANAPSTGQQHAGFLQHGDTRRNQASCPAAQTLAMIRLGRDDDNPRSPGADTGIFA